MGEDNHLGPETMEAMADVSSQLDSWNGFPVRAWHTGISFSSILPAEATASLDRKIPARRVHDRRAIMASDASDFAVASYSVEGLADFSFSEDLKESERGESSSYRELLAIDRTLAHISSVPGSLLKPSKWTTLWWLTDNQNVEKMLAKGSGKLKITRLVLKILKEGRKLMYDIQPIWVSRDNLYLQKADCLSKGIDSDNWEITDFDYAHLDAQFGPFSVDLFSTRLNAKNKRFYTRSYEDGMLGVDAFAHDWKGECAYAAPPVSLVMRTIHKAGIVTMNGILVVPLWKGAKFWVFTFCDGIHLNGIFKEMHLVRMTAVAWEISLRDRIGGKELQFLVLVLDSKRTGAGDLESVPGKGGCFRALFGKCCEKCDKKL
jgi:hypothetical protein